jgi:hypothetical protein
LETGEKKKMGKRRESRWMMAGSGASEGEGAG